MGIDQTGGSGQILKVTTDLPASGIFTLLCRSVRRSGTSSGFPTLMICENATASATAFNNMEMFSGVLGISTAATNTNFAVTPAVGAPFDCALVNAGSGANQLRGYWRAVGGKTVNTVSMTGSTFTPAQVALMSDSFNEPWDGWVDNVKGWTRALSQDEIEAEWSRIMPVSQDGLWVVSPFFTAADVLDLSGRGHHWAVTGTHVDAPGGTVPVRGRRRRKPIIRTAAGTPPPPPTGGLWLAAAA